MKLARKFWYIAFRNPVLYYRIVSFEYKVWNLNRMIDRAAQNLLNERDRLVEARKLREIAPHA